MECHWRGKAARKSQQDWGKFKRREQTNQGLSRYAPFRNCKKKGKEGDLHFHGRCHNRRNCCGALSLFICTLNYRREGKKRSLQRGGGRIALGCLGHLIQEGKRRSKEICLGKQECPRTTGGNQHFDISPGKKLLWEITGKGGGRSGSANQKKVAQTKRKTSSRRKKIKRHLPNCLFWNRKRGPLFLKSGNIRENVSKKGEGRRRGFLEEKIL